MWHDHDVEGLVRENAKLRELNAELTNRLNAYLSLAAHAAQLVAGDFRANAETEAAAPRSAEKPSGRD